MKKYSLYILFGSICFLTSIILTSVKVYRGSSGFSYLYSFLLIVGIIYVVKGIKEYGKKEEWIKNI